MKIDNITNMHESHPFVRKQNQEFELMELPYSTQALEPQMSRETVELHHGKHHQTYVTNMNKFIAGSDYENMNLRDIVKNSYEKDRGVFNNAAQNLNHIIFWNGMSPDKVEMPTAVAEALESAFGSLDSAREKFIDLGLKQFGSGWVYLILENGDMKFRTYSNADNPVGEDVDILAAFDVWEHSYYLDYKNDRKAHLTRVINELINYKFIESRLIEA